MNISYDKKSFIINGERKWLFMGEIHYFRFPRAEWRNVIRMAKAAGINTISTYLAWNYHETEEGKFDFSGDKDFAEFLDIAKSEGMYVFLRPGPYICAEWSGGGIPAWILNYENMLLRVTEETFMRCAENWLAEAMKFAVPRLITNGGNIIAVQNDNEYPGGWDNFGAAYIKFIYQTLRDLGVDVPITACNAHCKNGELTINYIPYYINEEERKKFYEDMIITYNTLGETQILEKLREFQPEKPTVITELWTGGQVYWGTVVKSGGFMPKTALLKMIAMQAEVNLYMFAGGTNFEYWGGKNIATSYSSTYPIGDANIPKPLYYELKPLGFFQNTFGGFLAECDFEILREDEVYLQKSKDGNLVYVASEEAECTYEYNGEIYDVDTSGIGYGIFPHELSVRNSVIKKSNISILGKWGKYLFFMGNGGKEFNITVNGKQYSGYVPYKAVKQIETEDLMLIVCDKYSAEHLWQTKDVILIGYDMAYDTEEGVYTELKRGIRTTKITEEKIETEVNKRKAEKSDLPQLKNWEIVNSFSTLSFNEIIKPEPHHKLGIQHGYVWYKAKARAACEGYYQMMIPAFLNRIFVYVNGEFSGIFGDKRNSLTRWDYQNPTDALKEAQTVYLKKGENEIIFLSEDTGYAFDDLLAMGIMSDVYFNTRLFNDIAVKDLGRTPITEEAKDYMYSLTVAEMSELNTIEFDLDLKEDETAFFVCHAKPCCIYVNNKAAQAVKFGNQMWHNWKNMVVWSAFSADNFRDKNKVTVQYYCATGDLLSHLKIYIAKKDSALYDWSYSAFCEQPEYGGKCDFENIVLPDSTLLVPGGEVAAASNDFEPKYFTTSFEYLGDEPIMLDIGDMKKGQIFLNGKNLGKFNGKTTQELYYIPKAYMKERNVLTLFEEYGTYPQGVKLVEAE